MEALIGAAALQYGIPILLGGVVGAILGYLTSSTICDSFEKHWFLWPLIMFIAGGGGGLMLAETLGFI